MMECPKVRFSQNCELITEKKDHEVKDTKIVTCNKGRVKVKSIVPTNYPVKVLDNGQRIILKDRIHEFDAEEFKHSDSISDTRSPERKIQYRNTTVTNESEASFSDVESCIHEIKKMSMQELPHNNASKNILENIVPVISLKTEDEDSDVEFIGIIDTSTNSEIKTHCKLSKISSDKAKTNSNYISRKKFDKRSMNKVMKKENKENFSKCTSLKSVTNMSQASNTILQESNKLSTCKTVEEFSKFQKPIQLMPCAKFRLSNSSVKNKTINKTLPTQVKKNTVFDIMGNTNKVSVEPGASHKNNDTYLDIVNNDKMIVSNDLLARPEYNSTIGVMKNLKEIQKEKIVKDFEHLPKVYQNFVSEKITTALDFSPYETVYKDLIDLTIDDDKLPTRVFRSKDPEPRDKDIIPKLSDFYNPKYTEQYFTTASIKPLDPINLNTLNAFTISNKVCMWKICRDNF